MGTIYTKNGRPVQVSGDHVHSRSGTYVGRLNGKYLFSRTGHYLATLDGNRLVYRSTDSARVGSPTANADRAGSGAADSAGSGLWGDEPNIPD
jgi:hypothetical protein